VIGFEQLKDCTMQSVYHYYILGELIMSNINFDLLGEIVEDQFGSQPTNSEDLLVEGLKPTEIEIDAMGLEFVPNRLRRLFSFNSDLCISPRPGFKATSVAIGIFAVRLDKDGNVTKAAPSIKSAHTSGVSKFVQGGDWGTRCSIMPDLFVEAEFHTNETEDVVVPIPTILKEPYPAKSGNVNLVLSTVNKTVDNWAEYHDAARAQFNELMGELAEHLGVAAGEQFLVCLLGFPTYSKAYESDGSSYWRCAFNGGYMVGGRKVGTSRNLPKSLAGLRVQNNLTIGNTSLSARIAAEVTKAKGATFVRPEAPAPQYEMPSSVGKAATPKREVSVPAVTTPKHEVPAAIATTTNAMPSAGILAKLDALASTVESDDDEWTLVDVHIKDEPRPTVISESKPVSEPVPELVINSEDSDEDDEPIVTQKCGRRANPFA
jgi:hypothetical protein